MPRWTRFRQLLGPDPQGDVDDELAFHLDMRADELVARGKARTARRSCRASASASSTRRVRPAWQISRRRRQKMARSEWARQFVQDVATRCGRFAERRALRPSPS